MQSAINIFDADGWESSHHYPAGTMQKVLRDEAGGKTILLRLPAGFRMSSHAHVAAEQHIVLEGSYASEGRIYAKGSYRLIQGHEDHGPFESEKGALILVVYDPLTSSME